ncbi:MAG: hypothetical protein ABSG49_05585 [Methanoregula sp.]|jgi:SAM-dependent methyltransferase|uniref:hypothetical protein n=1 Tax=Methanoregula sp. TaxID=2052170 RepID=UPI003C28B6F8
MSIKENLLKIKKIYEDNKDSIFREIVVPILIMLAIRIFLLIEYPFKPIFEEIPIDFLGVVIIAIVLRIISLFKIRGPIKELLNVTKSLDKKITAPLLKAIEKDIDEFQIIFKDTLSENGKILSFEEVTDLTHIFFEIGRGIYLGTDSHIPSEFYRYYPTYLEAQGKNIKTREDSIQTDLSDTRILIIKENDLKSDFFYHYEDVLRFITWHQDHKVHLKLIEPDQANLLIDDTPLKDNIKDFGLWGNYGLLFKPDKNDDDSYENVQLFMRLDSEPDYKNAKKYFLALNEKSKDINEKWIANFFREQSLKTQVALTTEHSKNLFDNYKLARYWNEFVCCEKRLNKEGSFLINLINHYFTESDYTIFDAALGIGCESIFLIRHFKEKNIRVISNEISLLLRYIAIESAKKDGVELEVYSWDWRKLNQEFPKKFGTLKVDMVLVLGNSLCLLPNKNDMIKSLENFKSVLIPGGLLVIDERNFVFMQKDKKNIEKDPIKKFKYHGDTLYCGTDVIGVPTKIAKERIIFTYFKKRESQKEKSIENLEEIGSLDMYSFKKNELTDLLKQTGFELINTFNDFDRPTSERCDFYIHVARAPM